MEIKTQLKNGKFIFEISEDDGMMMVSCLKKDDSLLIFGKVFARSVKDAIIKTKNCIA